MAEADDFQRLAINIEARIAAFEKQMAKVVKVTQDSMKGVGGSVDKGMRQAEQRAQAAGAKIGSALKQSLGGIKGQLLSSVGGFGGQVAQLTSGLGGLGAAGATAAGGLAALVGIFGALYVKGKEALSAADDIGDTADKLGISAEHLQEFRAVFNGLVDPQQVDAGIKKLEELVGLASAGVPKASKVFKALKIDIRDAVTGDVKDPSAVFLELADRISKLKSPAQQAAAAQKALGDSGIEMLPILRQGSAAVQEQIDKYRAMGAIISNETIAKAGDLQQQLDDLALVIRAQLTAALVDAGPQIVALTKWFAANLPQGIQIATRVIQFLADNLREIVSLFTAIAGFQIGAVLGSAFGPLGIAIGGLAGALAGGAAGWVAYGAAVDGVSKASGILTQMHPELSSFFTGVQSGSINAADGLKAMSAEARQAAVDLANLELNKSKIADLNLREQQGTIQSQTESINRAGNNGALGGATIDQDAVQHIQQYAWNINRLDFELSKNMITAQEYVDYQKNLNDTLAKQPEYVQKAAKAYADLQAQRDSGNAKRKSLQDILDAAATIPPGAPARTATGSLGDLGAGGGAGSKTKAPKDSKLAEYLQQLQTEVDRLALSGVALKENQLLTEALAKAKEDYKNKLRDSATLTDAETASIASQAKVLAGVPDILNLAKDKLPQFNLASQMKSLTELQALLKDPQVVAALQAQGLSAEDASKAIQAQILAVKDQATGTSEAITGIGDAFQNGIQGATSFADAVTKIGLALAQMLLQATLFGGTKNGGPLGGIFDSLTGLIGGLAGSFGGGGDVPSIAPIAIGHRAGGGYLGAGQPSIINELGQEAARRGGDLFIPGKPTTIVPADATRRSGPAANNNGGPPIQFNISMAGANGDRTIADIAAAAVKKGLASVPEINRQHKIRFS